MKAHFTHSELEQMYPARHPSFMVDEVLLRESNHAQFKIVESRWNFPEENPEIDRADLSPLVDIVALFVRYFSVLAKDNKIFGSGEYVESGVVLFSDLKTKRCEIILKLRAAGNIRMSAEQHPKSIGALLGKKWANVPSITRSLTPILAKSGWMVRLTVDPLNHSNDQPKESVSQ